jgi:hypothetical protein
MTSRFTAEVREPGSRRRRTVAASDPYSWTLRSDPLRDDPGYASAVQRLAAALEQAGWEPVEPGSDWWAARFVWRRDEAPPEQLEPAPAGASV